MPHSLANPLVATEGNELATSCHPLDDNAIAVRIWRETVDASGLDDKVLAIESGMSVPHYSKVASGKQGDLIGLIYRVGTKRPALRQDFICRLAEAEHADPLQRAAEQLAKASMRFLMLRGELTMAKASAGDRKTRKRSA